MKAIDSKKYIPKPSDKLIFDANVWIYLLHPGANNADAEQAYSNFYALCVANKATIGIPFTVISEVVNKSLKLEYKEELKRISKTEEEYEYKKHFRPSVLFRETVESLYHEFDKTLNFGAKLLEDQFNKSFFKTVFEELEDSDLNDNLIAEIAKRKGFMVVTNDRDFSSHANKVQIITADRKLIGKTK